MTVINQLVSNYLSKTIIVFILCEYNGKRQVLNIPIIDVLYECNHLWYNGRWSFESPVIS